jgi:hypothetical protein
MARQRRSRKKNKRFISSLLLFGLLFLSSCASLHFRTLPPPFETLQFASLNELPYRELWAGVVFNGEKVGFTRFTIIPAGENFRIQSEAHIRFRFLGMDHQVTLKGDDWVRPDLTLTFFHYEQRVGQKSWILSGEVSGSNLFAILSVSGTTQTIEAPLTGPLYPVSATNLVPVLKGLSPGAFYRYLVFDPQIQTLIEVSQSVLAFEESPPLGLEPAFRIETEMANQKVQTWINRRGEAIFELGMNGVLITHKEAEEEGKRFLSEGSFNKKDLVFDFSRVKTERPLPCPRQANLLLIGLEGIAGHLPILQGPGQDAQEKKEGETSWVLYRITRTKDSLSRWTEKGRLPESLQPYLRPTFHLNSKHPAIQEQARQIVAEAKTPLEKVERLTRWVAHEIQDEFEEQVSAVEVLQTRRGECQAHTMLYAAMARAVDIPTRVVGGLVYAEETGFLYHAWAESYIDGWVSIDPTFNQVGVDATHIKLVEGPDWPSLTPIGKVVGRVKAKILDYQASCP